MSKLTLENTISRILHEYSDNWFMGTDDATSCILAEVREALEQNHVKVPKTCLLDLEYKVSTKRQSRAGRK